MGMTRYESDLLHVRLDDMWKGMCPHSPVHKTQAGCLERELFLLSLRDQRMKIIAQERGEQEASGFDTEMSVESRRFARPKSSWRD